MKNVIITGASGNLGAATVEKFCNDGYRVLAMVSPGKLLPSVSESVEQFECDLTDEKGTEEVIMKMVAKYPLIEGALLLVGGFEAGRIDSTVMSGLRKMYALNFETAYNVMRPIFQHMKQQTSGGRIVLIGARPALDPKAGKGLIAYGLSKSLLFKLAEYLNDDGKEKNVLTAIVVPGTIDTPLNRSAMPAADFSKWATPAAIAEVMASFVSRKSVDDPNPIFKV